MTLFKRDFLPSSVAAWRRSLALPSAWVMLCAAAALAEPDSWRERLAPSGDAWRATRQEFVFNNDSEPETLDPHTMTGATEMRIALALFEGLTTLDPATLEVRPGLAANWETSPDGLVTTFRLRPNTLWSDGAPLRAADFVASWRRALTPATAASYAGMFFPILGAEQLFRGGEARDFLEQGVTAPDDRTLVVRLGRPCAYFLELTAFPTFAPVRVELIERHGGEWLKPGLLVGSGPFVLRQWEPRQRIVMERNPHYWDAGSVRLERVTALPLDDLNTAYSMYLRGGVDWLPSIPQARVEEIRRHADYYVTPYFGTYFYRFNVTRPPFDDRRVRRAFSLATDRREICEHVLRSGQQPVSTLCPPVAGYEPPAGLSTDRDAARALLAEAGFGPDGAVFPPVEILYNTSEGHKLVAEAVAQQWSRNLGVKATARNVEWKILLQDMRELNYQICRASWIGDYGDPSTFLDIFRSGDGNNRTGWSHKDYDAMADAAARETNPTRRRELFGRMEVLLVEDECPILPVYRYVCQGLVSPRVNGWFENARDLHNFKYVWMED
jgi:oligopeptide transport system substrate-binding protein